VVVLGFCVDLGVALLLRGVFETPLPLAAAGGFIVALSLNYLMFEAWAFRRAGSGLSVGRLAATVGSALIALVVRLAVVASLTALIGEPNTLTAAVIVIAGAVLSLVVNWVLVSRVFPRETGPY
jgi:putative flippase GtrA